MKDQFGGILVEEDQNTPKTDQFGGILQGPAAPAPLPQDSVARWNQRTRQNIQRYLKTQYPGAYEEHKPQRGWEPFGPRQRGIIGSLRAGMGQPLESQAAAMFAATQSDDFLKFYLNAAREQAEKQMPELTTSEKVAEFGGNLLTTLMQMAGATPVVGQKGAMASVFGTMEAGNAFTKAGVKALQQGRDPDEALAIAKDQAKLGGAVGAGSALLFPTGKIKRFLPKSWKQVPSSFVGHAGQVSGVLSGMTGAVNVGEKLHGLETPITEGMGHSALTGFGLVGVPYAAGRALRWAVTPRAPRPAAGPPAPPGKPRMQPPPLPGEAAGAAEAVAPMQGQMRDLSNQIRDLKAEEQRLRGQVIMKDLTPEEHRSYLQRQRDLRGQVSILEAKRNDLRKMVVSESKAMERLGEFQRQQAKGGETPSARQNQKTEELYGAVPKPSGEGAGQVPVEKGGAGVRTETEKVSRSKRGQPLTPDEERRIAELKQAQADREALGEQVKPYESEELDDLYEKQERAAIDAGEPPVIDETTGAPAPEVDLLASASYYAKQNKLESRVRLVDEMPPGDQPFDVDEIALPGRDGRIYINRRALRAFIEEDMAGATPEQIQTAINAKIAHEGIHLRVFDVISEAELADLWNNRITGMERWMVGKSYRGQKIGLKSGELGWGEPNLMGHEYLRRVISWSMEVPVDEVASAVRRGWLSEKAIDLALRGIHKIRTRRGTETSKVVADMLRRSEENLTTAKRLIAQQQRPATRRKLTEEEKERNVPGLEDIPQEPEAVLRHLDDIMSSSEKWKQAKGGTELLWEIGNTFKTPEEIQSLMEWADGMKERAAQELAKPGFQGKTYWGTVPMYVNEIIEGALKPSDKPMVRAHFEPRQRPASIRKPSTSEVEEAKRKYREQFPSLSEADLERLAMEDLGAAPEEKRPTREVTYEGGRWTEKRPATTRKPVGMEEVAKDEDMEYKPSGWEGYEHQFTILKGPAKEFTFYMPSDATRAEIVAAKNAKVREVVEAEAAKKRRAAEEGKAKSQEYYDKLAEIKKRLKAEHPYAEESMVNIFAMDEMRASEEKRPAARRKPMGEEPWEDKWLRVQERLRREFVIANRGTEQQKSVNFDKLQDRLENWLKEEFPDSTLDDREKLINEAFSDWKQGFAGKGKKATEFYKKGRPEAPTPPPQEIPAPTGEVAPTPGRAVEPTGAGLTIPERAEQFERAQRELPKPSEALVNSWYDRLAERYPDVSEPKLQEAAQRLAKSDVDKTHDRIWRQRIRKIQERIYDENPQLDPENFDDGIEVFAGALNELRTGQRYEPEQQAFPASRRKRAKPGEGQEELDFTKAAAPGAGEKPLPFGKVGQGELPFASTPPGVTPERPGVGEIPRAFEPVKPRSLAKIAIETIREAKVPSFREFVARSKVAFGPQARGRQLLEIWRERVWKTLMNMSDEERNQIKNRLGISAAAKSSAIEARALKVHEQIKDLYARLKASKEGSQERADISRAIDAKEDEFNMLEKRSSRIASRVEALKPSEQRMMSQRARREAQAEADAQLTRDKLMARVTRMEKQADDLMAEFRKQSQIWRHFRRQGYENPAKVAEAKLMGASYLARARSIRNKAKILGQLTRTTSDAALPKKAKAQLPDLFGRKAVNDIARIGMRLLGKTGLLERKLNRKTITPEDIGWKREKEGIEPAFRKITEPESRTPDLLAKIATSGARLEASGKGAPNQTISRRVLAVLDKFTRRVELLGVYKTSPGKGRPALYFIVDPIKILGGKERTHTQMIPFFNQKLSNGQLRFRALASYMLEDPVQFFRQTFPDVADYKAKLEDQVRAEANRPAVELPESISPEQAAESERQRLRMERAEGEYEGPRVTEEGEEIPYEEAPAGEVPSEYVSRQEKPLTDAEAGRLYDFLAPERGAEDPMADIQSSLESLYEENRIDPFTKKVLPLSPKQAAVVDALLKARQRVMAQNPDMSEIAALNQVLESIRDTYEITDSKAEGRQTFIRDVARVGEESEPGVEPLGPPAPEEARATGRELTMPISRRPPTAVEGAGVPKGPGPAPTYGAERLPAAVRKAPRTDSDFRIRDIIPGTLRYYSEWMVERLQRAGGPATRAAARMFNRIINNEKRNYGELTDVLDPALEEAGKPGDATKWINGIDEVTPDAAIGRAPGAIEGTINVPKIAERLVELAQAANLRIGQLYEAVTEGFKATGKWQRNLTAFGYDLVRKGSGRVWEAMVKGNAIANGVPLREARLFFQKMKRIYDEPSPSVARIEKVNQDFTRLFPKAITHVRVRTLVGSRWEPVLHSNLYRYLDASARRASHVRAFREEFGFGRTAESAIKPSTMLNAMNRAVRAELDPSYQKDYDAVIRAMQGHPSDNYAGMAVLAPDMPVGATLRMFNQTVGNLMARMVLTGQMAVQMGETLAGSTPVFLGWQRYLRAMARIATDGQQLYRELERTGARNRVIYDFSVDPSARIRTEFRRAGNLVSKLFAEQFLNELQEGSAAATARLAADDIAAGRLSNWDRRMLGTTFEKMGFSKAEAADMLANKRPDLLDQFVNKAAAWLTSGNKSIAQGSRLGASRLFNSIFRFQSYAMAKTNQFRKVVEGIARAVDDVRQDNTLENRQRLVNESAQLGKFLFGNMLQGALTVGITSLFYEKLFGVKIRAQEAKEEPVKFLTEAFLASMSGPLYLLWRSKDRGGLAGIGEQVARSIFPYEIIRNMYDAGMGKGYYSDMSPWARLGKFIQQKIPATKFLSAMLSIKGLSWENKDLETASRAFYRWRFDRMGKGGGPPDNEEYRNRRYFRTHMKRAIQLLKMGKLDEVHAEIAKAAQSPDLKPGSIVSSLNARRILKTPNMRKLGEDEIAALRKHIGDQAVDMLVYHDAMIDALVDAYSQ